MQDIHTTDHLPGPSSGEARFFLAIELMAGYPKIRASTTMRDGTPIGSFVSGDSDDQGYVCPAGGIEGGPPGFSPDAVFPRIRIDPHMGGPTIELSQLTKASLARATEDAQVRAPGLDLDSWRERGASAFINAAVASHAVVSQIPVTGQGVIEMPAKPKLRDRSRPKPEAQQQAPAAPPEIQMQPAYQKIAEPVGAAVPYTPPQPMPPATAQAYQMGPGAMLPQQPQGYQPVPMSPAYPQAPAPQQPPPYLQPAHYPQGPSMQPVAPGQSLFQTTQSKPPMFPPADPMAGGGMPVAPSIRVQYEIDGFPMKFDGYFHQVIVTDSSLVLAFDERAVGYPRQYPAANVDQKIALTVVGQPYVYVISSPKHIFKFNGYEMCVADILSQHQIEGQQNGQVRPNNPGYYAGPRPG